MSARAGFVSMLTFAVALLGASLGCDRLSERRAAQAEAGAEPPAQWACSEDRDCVPAPLVDPGNPCCDSGMALTVASRAWVAWRAAFKAGHCAAAECPPIPSPQLPLPCGTQGRCVAGQCTHACTRGEGGRDADVPP